MSSSGFLDRCSLTAYLGGFRSWRPISEVGRNIRCTACTHHEDHDHSDAVGRACRGVLAALMVPPSLAWYSAPGGLPKGAQIQAVVEIPEVIRYATDKLIRWQAIAAASARS